MRAALGLLALAVLGADGPPRLDAPQITFQMHVIEMKGVGWRESVYAQLQPVTRQGNASIWTVGRGATKTLTMLADTVIHAPRLTAFAQASAHVSPQPPMPSGCAFEWCSQVSWLRQDQVNLARYEAPEPMGKDVHPSFAARFTGRKLDQGVLTKFVLEETRVLAVHTVMIRDRKDSRHDGGDVALAALPVQVPEIVKSDVIGEWLIPNDGALVISLGAHTVAGAEEKAEVRERLVVLETRQAAAPPTMAAAPPLINPLTSCIGIARGEDRHKDTAVPMPAPAAPSRSLPQPMKADGTSVPLPPLPPDKDTPTSLPNSSEPCASPQSRTAPEPKALDPDSTPTSLNAAKPAPTGQADSTLDLTEVSLSFVLRTGALVLDHCDRPRLSSSGKSMHDDVEYFPPGLDFLWSITRAAAQCARMQAMGFEPSPASKKAEGTESKPDTSRSAWTAVKPYSIHLPLNGATIEVRVTPRYRNAGIGRPDKSMSPCREDCEKDPSR